jgi:hypothetical protein
MTPLTSMWLASIAGASLFFIAGFFLARRHLGEAAAVDVIVPPRTPPPVVDASRTTAAAEPPDPLPTVQALRAQVNELRNALRDARVREQGHSEIEREVVRLRGDRSELELQARRELAIELESARRQLGELDQGRDENAVLRQQLAMSAADHDKLAAAELELRALRARGLSAAPPPRMPRAGTSPLHSVGDPRSTAEQLSGLLSRLRGKSMRAVALSDEQGLPIVGLGDDVSSLAAFAGFVTEIGRRTRDFLPMSALRRVTVEDENDATITACPHANGDAHIALITLTVGPGPSARQMGDVLRSAASLIK